MFVIVLFVLFYGDAPDDVLELELIITWKFAKDEYIYSMPVMITIMI